MSLYREVRGGARRLLILAAIAVLIGLAGGFVLGRATEGEPSLAGKVADFRDDAQKVASALEVLAVEYPQAVRGSRVVAQTEYTAAKADVERAHTAFEEIQGDLQAIFPQRVALAESQLHELEKLVKQTAPPEQVLNQAAKVRETLQPAFRLGTAG
jgi:hypothetical protein